MPGRYKPLRIQTGPVDERSAGQLVVGRDKLVEGFWEKLQSGSQRVVAERRMGKTWVLNLALARKPDWANPVLFDAERPDSAAAFVMQLNDALHRKGFITDDAWTKVGDWFRRGLQQLQGQKIAGLSVPTLDPWDSLLSDTCRQFSKRGAGRQAVLMIDELPFFLDKLVKADRAGEAIQFLDTFRALRQELPRLRMVFCGSLGLHIVMDKLRTAGYTGQPVNDMTPFPVPPLSEEDAAYLAGCLLVGEGVACSDLEKVAGAVGRASSGVPFYIQRMVEWMTEHAGKAWTPRSVGEVPHSLFHDANDRAQFRYYDERLDSYYPSDIVEKARVVLDVVARHAAGIEFETLLNEVRHCPKTQTTEEEELRRVLRILREDHYLGDEGKGWRFRLEIVRRWWADQRGGDER